MSAKLGTLTLDLVAKIGNFVEPMNQAEKKAKGTSQTIAESFNVSALAVNALGAAFAGVTVGGLAAFTNQVIDTGNEIKKLSQLSNTSTFDFQFYAKGAETAGISMESFADKMKDMQDRIGDFQQTGGGPLADFFTNIAPLVGVTIEQFQKLSGPEALQLFYNSLEKVGATQNDMKFYMESIISDSSLLIPLLENGGKGFKEWGQAASDAGTIMSTEMIEKLVEAKKSMQMLDLQVEGVQVSLINGLAPVVQTVANNLDVVAVATGTVAVVMTAKATPAFVMGTIEATRYQLALARMSAQAAGTTTTLTVLGGVARGALGLLGGPAGLALTVAAVAGSYLLFRDNTAKSTVSLRENNETVEQAIQKYTELDKIKRAAQLVDEREKLEELSTSYLDANSKLISYSLSVVRNADMTSSQATKFSQLILDYKSGKTTLEQLSDAVSKSTALSSDEKDAFIKKAASVRDASNEVNTHKNLISQMIDRDKQFIKNNDDVTGSIDRRSAATLKLTQKERDVYNSIGQEMERENYINANVSRGFMSRNKAEYFADKRAEAGIPYSKLLSKEMFIQIEQGYKLQQQTEKREETEKKIADEQKKRADFAEKNYSYTKSELALYQRIAKLSAETDLNGIGARYGIPNNMLAALMGHESKGNPNAVSPTGAIGYFQTTSRWRKDNGISVEDSKNLPVIADAVARSLSKAFQELGSWEAAILSHNAGVGGARQFGKTGRVDGGAARNKEVANFVPKVDKIFAALNGSSLKDSGLTGKEAVLSIKELGEYWEKAEQLRKESQDRQKTVAQKYFTEEERMAEGNAEARKEIEIAFAGDDEAIVQYLLLQEKAYNKDVKAFKKAQQEKMAAAFTALQNPLSEMQNTGMNATAIATLNPQQYQMWDLNNQQQAGYSQLSDSFSSAQAAINDNELLTETERYAQLEMLYEQYLQNKAALAGQYAVEEQKLIQSQHDAQMGIWQDLLTRTGSVFSQMAEMVKNTAGESSAAYKAMFLFNQGISIAQAMINTEVAATKAMAEGGYVAGIPMATAIRALGYASVGMIAAQTISGMAHDGIDNIPKEGTWLLDKGERVVDSRTNADLKGMIANQKNGGGDVHIQVNVTDSGVSAQSNQSDQKQLGQMIGNAVRAVIRQEQRQGGLLAK